MTVCALAAFVGAAIGGLLVNRPAPYREARIADLRRLIDERFWTGRASVGSRRAAEVRIDILDAARAQNRIKAQVLRVAMSVEVVAVALLAAAVGSAVIGLT